MYWIVYVVAWLLCGLLGALLGRHMGGSKLLSIENLLYLLGGPVTLLMACAAWLAIHWTFWFGKDE